MTEGIASSAPAPTVDSRPWAAACTAAPVRGQSVCADRRDGVRADRAVQHPGAGPDAVRSYRPGHDAPPGASLNGAPARHGSLRSGHLHTAAVRIADDPGRGHRLHRGRPGGRGRARGGGGLPSRVRRGRHHARDGRAAVVPADPARNDRGSRAWPGGDQLDPGHRDLADPAVRAVGTLPDVVDLCARFRARRRMPGRTLAPRHPAAHLAEHRRADPGAGRHDDGPRYPERDGPQLPGPGHSATVAGLGGDGQRFQALRVRPADAALLPGGSHRADGPDPESARRRAGRHDRPDRPAQVG